jgi:hypothetical protein
MSLGGQSTATNYARYRLLSSVGGKLADAAGVVMTIKTLSVADYGVIGAAMGLMAVVGFVNLAPEDILWRDQPRLRDQLGEHLSAYLWFWGLKLAVVVAIAATFCGVYGAAHQAWGVAIAMFAIACLQQVLTASPLLEVPLFAGLQQQRGAAFVLGVRAVWLVLLALNFRWHSLVYYIVALAMYSLATATLSVAMLRRHFGVHFGIRASEAWRKVREAALDFTLWLHLVGRARVFLQRGDLAIFGALGLTLAAIGQYTVAINLVGFALILPGVLENVAAVSFAHQPEQRIRNLRKYFAVAVALAVGQLASALVFGRTALRVLHVADVDSTFRIFLTLMAGVSVFIVQTPVLAYAMCFRRMRNVFLTVFLPACGFFAVGVAYAAWTWSLQSAAAVHAGLLAMAGVAATVFVFTNRDIGPVADAGTAEAESTFQE